jgi:hypothetical protein
MAKAKDRILLGFLEGISWRVLEEYPQVVAEQIRRKAGVYALYKNRKLYYVGLASNLMGRIKHHLKDRHKGLWDRFSVYATHNNEHVKQLESLLLRIATPAGNRVKGNFGGSTNLYRTLHRAMTVHDADKRASLLGGHAARQRRRRKTSQAKGTLVLAGSVDRRLPLRAKYKGNLYRATLRLDGYISLDGQHYESPSAAARSIVKRQINGWSFWEYKDGPRKWLPLSELRK